MNHPPLLQRQQQPQQQQQLWGQWSDLGTESDLLHQQGSRGDVTDSTTVKEAGLKWGPLRLSDQSGGFMCLRTSLPHALSLLLAYSQEKPEQQAMQKQMLR